MKSALQVRFEIADLNKFAASPAFLGIQERLRGAGASGPGAVPTTVAPALRKPVDPTAGMSPIEKMQHRQAAQRKEYAAMQSKKDKSTSLPPTPPTQSAPKPAAGVADDAAKAGKKGKGILGRIGGFAKKHWGKGLIAGGVLGAGALMARARSNQQQPQSAYKFAMPIFQERLVEEYLTFKDRNDSAESAKGGENNISVFEKMLGKSKLEKKAMCTMHSKKYKKLKKNK